MYTIFTDANVYTTATLTSVHFIVSLVLSQMFSQQLHNIWEKATVNAQNMARAVDTFLSVHFN